MAKSKTCLTLKHIDPRWLKPSPENEEIYRLDPDSRDILDLAEDIRQHGILEPLIVTQDNYILSGHRRREAAIKAGLQQVPYRTVKIRRWDDDYNINPAFIRTLTSYNRQRIKSRPELFKEAVIQANSDDAYTALIRHREKQSQINVATIKVGERGARKQISKGKEQMVNAVIDVLNDNHKYWPLSDRQVHYRLLNNPPLKHTKKRDSLYRNDRASYQDLCNLLTRLRLDGTVPMDAIADPTRPVSNWWLHQNTQEFTKSELDNFLTGYRRDLQQSQPLHIVVVAEKMTVESIIRPVCSRFNIPYVIGRGYSSLPARAGIVNKFKQSCKAKMLLLILSDFDPEGISIGETLLQSLREDFCLDNVEAVRVGLNQEHIQRFNLSDNIGEAKESSTRYKAFVKRYGKKVYELESLTPSQLQGILKEKIDSVIDVDQFNMELDTEKQDAAYIQTVRNKVYAYLKDAGIE